MININLKRAKMDNVRKIATNNITNQDLKKSFELYEKKLIELSQKFSSQKITNNDYYHPQTKWHNVEIMGADGNMVTKIIPVTKL